MHKLVVVALVVLAMPMLVRASVIISEVAWMGTSLSASDEWIELYNPDSTAIPLDGWTLEIESGGPKVISLSGSISPGGYYLLERTDDTTVPDKVADQIYTGALNNTNEGLILKNNGIEAHKIEANPDWPAGDNTTKETMQWSKTSWTTALGTPRESNAGVRSVGGDESNTTTTPTTQSLANESVGTVDSRSRPKSILKIVAPSMVREHVPEYYNAELVNVASVPDIYWSFGDGATGVGTSVWHTFDREGTYVISVRAHSLGPQAVARQRVRVYKPSVEISTAHDGINGFVTIQNKVNTDFDLGGYSLVSGPRVFRIPADTIVLADDQVSLPAQITRLDSLAESIELRAPNDVVVSSLALVALPVSIVSVLPKDDIITTVSIPVVKAQIASPAIPTLATTSIPVVTYDRALVIPRKNKESIWLKILAAPRTLISTVFANF